MAGYLREKRLESASCAQIGRKADLVPPERRGTAYGVYNAAIGLTVFPASLLAGFLLQGVGSWHGFGPSAPFYFGAGLAIMAGLLFWRLFSNVEGS